MRAAIEQVLTDRRLAKTRPAFFEGAIEHAAKQYEGSPSAELLIIETPETPDAIFQQIEQLSRVCRPETNLILIGRHNDVGALPQSDAGRASANTCRCRSIRIISSNRVVAVCADPEDMKQGRLISFIAASGGAGSTTIANNVAWCLGKLYDSEVDAGRSRSRLRHGRRSTSISNRPRTRRRRWRRPTGSTISSWPASSASTTTISALLTSPGECARAADIDPAALEEMLTAAAAQRELGRGRSAALLGRVGAPRARRCRTRSC